MTKLFSANKNIALAKNERLVMAATVHIGKAAAEKRFVEALAGRGRSVADGIPLYAVVKADNLSSGGLTTGEKNVCDEILGDFMQMFAQFEKEGLVGQ